MREIRKEYALALFELALEEGELERVAGDVLSIKDAIKEAPQLIDMLKTPAIPMAERLSLIDEIFSDTLCEHAVSFIKVLCESSRIDLLSECVDEFEALVKAFTGKLTVKVTSAVSLTEEQKAALVKKLYDTHKRQIDPVYRVDPAIMGGLIIETEDKIYDGSVKASLRSVKEVMNG